MFPALIVSNNFATIDYDAQINTKIDYNMKPGLSLYDSTRPKHPS